MTCMIGEVETSVTPISAEGLGGPLHETDANRVTEKEQPSYETSTAIA